MESRLGMEGTYVEVEGGKSDSKRERDRKREMMDG